MEILDEDLVEIDLNDDSSDDENQFHYDKNSPVNNNNESNVAIPLIENSSIQEIKDNDVD